MKYVYNCKEHGEFVVDKPMSESGKEETCKTCGKVATRDYSSGIKTAGLDKNKM